MNTVSISSIRSGHVTRASAQSSDIESGGVTDGVYRRGLAAGRPLQVNRTPADLFLLMQKHSYPALDPALCWSGNSCPVHSWIFMNYLISA